MRECCTYGSERGALSNGRSYRDQKVADVVVLGSEPSGYGALRAIFGASGL
jgi:hypothetical protein